MPAPVEDIAMRSMLAGSFSLALGLLAAQANAQEYPGRPSPGSSAPAVTLGRPIPAASLGRPRPMDPLQQGAHPPITDRHVVVASYGSIPAEERQPVIRAQAPDLPGPT